MIKVFAVLCACAIAVVTIFSFAANSAFASVPRYSFQTEDGKWDGEVYNPNAGSNVEIDLVQPLYAKYVNGGTKKLNDTSKLRVRLCNAKTKKCTNYHNLAGGKTLFTNLKAGHFYVDVRDGFSNAHVSGKLDIVFK